MTTFLMLAAGAPEPMARLIRASAKTSTTVVLDLEDALWDVGDQARTSALKAAGRENLAILATQHRDLFDRLPLGVRVNRLSGPEGGRDLLALGRACRFVQLDCIVLPLRRRGLGSPLLRHAVFNEPHGGLVRHIEDAFSVAKDGGSYLPDGGHGWGLLGRWRARRGSTRRPSDPRSCQASP